MSDALARALALFDAYVDLPAAERTRKLAALAASDPALHAALRDLLDSDLDEDAGVLDRSPAQIVAAHQPRGDDGAGDGARSDGAAGRDAEEDERDDRRVGERLGVWRLDRILGRGGMGTVYAAHRDDGQYQQQVALKCIRSELDSPELVAAFRAERNLLARLDHPGIAGVVDGGIDGDGRPWFALRRVEGEPIDAWCDRRGLDVGARAELLAQACDALAYAHAQGILHRDIKPSNLLVTADGRVQLLDFGISTRFGGDADAGAHLAITPDYAAPEARQHGIQGPATDLYMLGVLSYRLLCGQWPTRLHGLRELLPIAVGNAPEPMDRLLDDADDELARRRGLADVAALQRTLGGDLAAVALKAVAHKPQDRYPSVAEFARDLRAWREHRPVGARRAGWRERLGKWRRRNRAAATLFVSLALVVAAGLAAIGWQHQRAQREARASQAVGRLFASTLGSATQSGLGSAPFSSRALLERTERELRAMRLDDQPDLKARSLGTLARSYALMGDYRRAEALVAEAQRTLGAGDDRDGFLASTRLSLLIAQARYAEALQLARAQLDGLDGRGDEVARTSRVTIGAQMALAQWYLGRPLDALAAADRVVAEAERLGRGHEELLAQALIRRAGLRYRLMRAAPAEADVRRAIALVRPLNPVLADDALEVLMRIVQLQPNLDARELARELVRNRTRTLGAAHPKTAYAKLRLSVFPDSGLSKSEIAAALTTMREVYGPDNPQYASALASSAWAIARDRDDGLELQRSAVRVLDRHLPPGSEMRGAARYNLALALLYGADAADAREVEEGLAALRESIAEEVRAGLPATTERALLVQYLLDRGGPAQWPEAERTLADLRAETVALFGAGNYRLQDIDYFQAKLSFRQGRGAPADAGFARLIERDRAFIDAGGAGQGALTDFQTRSLYLTRALLYRAVYALRTCRAAQAQAFAAQAVQLSSSAPLIAAQERLVVRAYLDGVRRRRLPAVGHDLLSAAERERIDLDVRRCGDERG
ncbi:serine/threonine-protein kinase [Lysobacter enzymogenes]|uniref:serine/threonine-protein kinase n=1 Tax=Lysobacter enzymogenes TaxID=69 RepID=UPI001A95651F|nr:serine/threonine-protein kinase [Lysobacter enzymogenes]QQP97697.1 serine/threonine protein kinase [Lysobacter enzymogenes]